MFLRRATLIAAAIATAIGSASPASAADLQGFMSPVPFWDQTFTSATLADCTAEGFNGISTDRAWRLPGGALACAPHPAVGAWGGRIVNVWLYFDPNVDAQKALTAFASILPADSQQVGSLAGVNADYSKYQSGSCQEVVYGSGALAAAVSQANPSWTADPHKVSAVLYSGNATSPDGSDQAYRSGSVHLALVGLGGENRGADGVVHG
jgi:hypothetical protein